MDGLSECRNTDGQVARASRRCALVALIKAASLARTGAARHSPTTAGDWDPPYPS